MKELRQQMGSAPVYISFDIDALDPAFAPGTGEYRNTLALTIESRRVLGKL